LDAELSRLVLTVRHTPADHLDGILRKVDLYFRLTNEPARATLEFRNDTYPLDPDFFSQSICNDLAVWGGNQPTAPGAAHVPTVFPASVV
jgi:hypothetical protein